MSQFVYGKNVIHALLDTEKKIYEMIIVHNFCDAFIMEKIKAKKIPCKFVERKELDQKFPNSNHQGIVASIDPYPTFDLQGLLAQIPTNKTPLLVMLDGIEDPHNIGAIMRSAACTGVDGIIIKKHHSAKLTPIVAKVSSGAIEHVNVCVVTNLVQTLKSLKTMGYWVAGADMENAQDYRLPKYDTPLVLIIGSEGFGLSQLVYKHCDYLISLPMEKTINSLNASVACGVLLYQIYAARNPL